MEQSLYWQANRSSASQEIPLFYGTRKFITAPTSKKLKFLQWEVVSTYPNPQAREPPLVGRPRLLIQYIRSYPPYLEAVPPSATWGRAMPWWQGPTYHGVMPWWQGPTYQDHRTTKQSKWISGPNTAIVPFCSEHFGMGHMREGISRLNILTGTNWTHSREITFCAICLVSSL